MPDIRIFRKVNVDEEAYGEDTDHISDVITWEDRERLRYDIEVTGSFLFDRTVYTEHDKREHHYIEEILYAVEISHEISHKGIRGWENKRSITAPVNLGKEEAEG